MWAALVALLVLGVWWPAGGWNYLARDRARRLAERRNDAVRAADDRTARTFPPRLRDLLQRGGRPRFAYAWRPGEEQIELRYVVQRAATPKTS